MNKLHGFYALANSNLPSVPWQKYTEDTIFEDAILWTVRSAVKEGNDLNLPRKIGVNGTEAKQFAQSLMENLKSDDMVLYYPFFIALKSGVIEISKYRTVIEAVKDDLWNLVTHGKRDITIIFDDENIQFIGDEAFIQQEELFELIDYSALIKKQFHQEIAQNKSIFLEWSYACTSDINKQPIGQPNLVFYEIRAV